MKPLDTKPYVVVGYMSFCVAPLMALNSKSYQRPSYIHPRIHFTFSFYFTFFFDMPKAFKRFIDGPTFFFYFLYKIRSIKSSHNWVIYLRVYSCFQCQIQTDVMRKSRVIFFYFCIRKTRRWNLHIFHFIKYPPADFECSSITYTVEIHNRRVDRSFSLFLCWWISREPFQQTNHIEDDEDDAEGLNVLYNFSLASPTLFLSLSLIDT